MIIQTTDEADLETIANQALPASATAKDLKKLIEAIRSANPGLDLNNIQPGMAIIVPMTSTSAADQSMIAETIMEADRLVDDAVLAQTRAEADRDSAQRQAEASAADVTGLRAELAQVRADAQQAQSRLRDEARAEREALRAQHGEQLAEIQRHADERVAKAVGVEVPRKGRATKAAADKQPAGKQTSAKPTAAKKSLAKKATTARPGAKKTPAKNAPAKAAAKNTTAKTAGPAKTPAQKTSAKAVAKKPPAKKPNQR